MKAFAISRGSYSDYSVVAVFSTREKATEFLPYISGTAYDQPFIEEFEMNPAAPSEKTGWTMYRVTSKTHGALDVASVKAIEGLDYLTVRDWGYYVVDVIARDTAHATKIAADKFRDYKATHPVVK